MRGRCPLVVDAFKLHDSSLCGACGSRKHGERWSAHYLEWRPGWPEGLVVSLIICERCAHAKV